MTAELDYLKKAIREIIFSYTYPMDVITGGAIYNLGSLSSEDLEKINRIDVGGIDDATEAILRKLHSELD